MSDERMTPTRSKPDLHPSDLRWPDCRYLDYYDDVLDDERNHAFLLVETDDGWMVKVTIPTAGAVTSVSETFLLPDHWQDFLTHFHSDMSDGMVFNDWADGGPGDDR